MIKHIFNTDVLFEEENAQQTETNNQAQNDEKTVTRYKSIDGDEKISAINQALAAAKKELDQKMAVLNPQLTQQIDIISKNVDSGNYNSSSPYSPVEVDSKIISIKEAILAAEKDYYNKYITNKSAEIARLKELSSIKESVQLLPEKYAVLNESSLNNAKIYLSEFFRNMEKYPEKYMSLPEYNRLFRTSNLLYGKDKKSGLYVVCLDQNDFNKLEEILKTCGFTHKEIQNCIMSQVLNRRDIV